MIGICFGAQLIASSLEGNVQKIGGGNYFAWQQRIKLNANYKDQHFVKSSKIKEIRNANQFDILQSHGDHISQLPTNGILLSSTEVKVDTENESKNVIVPQLYTIGNQILGIQGHPDINYNNCKLFWKEQLIKGSLTVEDVKRYERTIDVSNLGLINRIVNEFLDYSLQNKSQQI